MSPLVFGREFFSEPEPGPVGRRGVLHGMVPPLLIVGAAIGRAEVERVTPVQLVLDTKVDADKSARGLARIRAPAISASITPSPNRMPSTIASCGKRP
jgi:hypothetical protein